MFHCIGERSFSQNDAFEYSSRCRHCRLGVAVLVAQPLEDPLGGVALLPALRLVVFQDLVDNAHPRIQLRPARRLPPPVPRGTGYRSIFRTVSRASPNCLAASRSLILSTTTARALAHTAPLCIPLRCSTKHKPMGMFDGTSLVGGLVLLRQQRRSRGVYWSSSPAARIREIDWQLETKKRRYLSCSGRLKRRFPLILNRIGGTKP